MVQKLISNKMKKKIILLLGAGYLTLAMGAPVMAESLPCLSGSFVGSSGDFTIKCHTSKGFALGCILTTEQIVKFREMIDSSLQKNGHVNDLQKNGDVVTFTYSWNGIPTEYEATWEESISSFTGLIVSNTD